MSLSSIRMYTYSQQTFYDVSKLSSEAIIKKLNRIDAIQINQIAHLIISKVLQNLGNEAHRIRSCIENQSLDLISHKSVGQPFLLAEQQANLKTKIVKLLEPRLKIYFESYNNLYSNMIFTVKVTEKQPVDLFAAVLNELSITIGKGDILEDYSVSLQLDFTQTYQTGSLILRLTQESCGAEFEHSRFSVI